MTFQLQWKSSHLLMRTAGSLNRSFLTRLHFISFVSWTGIFIEKCVFEFQSCLRYVSFFSNIFCKGPTLRCHLAYFQEIYTIPSLRKHDNILRYFGAEVHGNDFWLITEFHDNGSLFDFLKVHFGYFSCVSASVIPRCLKDFSNVENVWHRRVK